MLIKEKKGDEKYYILISLILGIIVLGLSMYFIFNEYFTDEDLNWETCRQSILVRQTLPDSSVNDLAELKEKFPLKCKTEVIDFETEATDPVDISLDYSRLRMDKEKECKSLFGEGLVSPFSNKFWGGTNCMICFRIHLDDEEFDAVQQFDGGSKDNYVTAVFSKDAKLKVGGEEVKYIKTFDIGTVNSLCDEIHTVPA